MVVRFRSSSNACRASNGTLARTAGRRRRSPRSDAPRFGMVHPNLSAVLYDQSGKEIGRINVAELQATLPPGVPLKAAPQTFGYATSSADQAVYQILADQVVDLENTAFALQGETMPKSATPANPSP